MEEIHLIQGKTGIELPNQGGNWILKKEEGYSPVESLVAAIASCGGYVYQKVLTNSQVPFVFHSIHARYTRDDKKAAQPLKEVEILFEVTVAEEFQGRAQRSVELVAKNCPVIQSVSSDVLIHEKVAFVEG